MLRRPLVLGWLIALLAASPALAQHAPLLGGAGPPLQGLGQVAGGVVGDLTGDVHETVGTLDRDLAETASDLDAARLTRLRDLVRANPRALEGDANGAPVVRGEVMAIDPSPRSAAIAAGAGFTVLRTTTLDPLGIQIVVLSPPEGMSARAALGRLRKLDPGGRYDLDHIYAPSGDARPPGPAPGTGSHQPLSAPSNAVVGMLDSGVDAGHPVFVAGRIEQKAFSAGGLVAALHGTAVASLMVGRGSGFAGAAPGARLYAADVYGSGPAGGSADDIVRALAWMAREHVPVINVSLVGPANLTLEVAVEALIARGEIIVAPVGNDGPAAPPLYPASYPGVIAVTAVDAHDRLLFEAGRASHIDFAARGASVAVARPGGGFTQVRGTSFAAPVVSGRLAALMSTAAPGVGADAPKRVVAALAAAARQAKGDAGLGHGVVDASSAPKILQGRD